MSTSSNCRKNPKVIVGSSITFGKKPKFDRRIVGNFRKKNRNVIVGSGGRVQRTTKSIHLDLFYLSTSAFGFRLGPKSGTFQPLHFSKKRFRFRTDMAQKRPFRIFSFFDKAFRCSVNCLVPRFRTKSWPIYMTFRAGGSGVTFSSKSGLFDILTS